MIIDFLERVKTERVEARRREVIASRFKCFMKAVPRLQPYKPGVPSPVDIALGLPSIREIIEQPVEVDVNEESFEVIRDSLPAFVARWQRDVPNFFANLVKSSYDVPADVDPLSLAVGAYFACECGQTSSSYQSASWHRCKHRRLSLGESEGDAFLARVASTFPASLFRVDRLVSPLCSGQVPGMRWPTVRASKF